MTQENLITLIKELMEVTELHQEYQDNDIHFVIDAEKPEDNILNIKVQFTQGNREKEEFENWLQTVDDSVLEEVFDALSSEGLKNLDEIYNSEDYKEVIEKVQSKTKEIVSQKIKELQKLLA